MEKVNNLFDAIVIGAGPAGISASIYLSRASKKVLVLYKPTSEVEKAIIIDNYYGFEDGIRGADLYNIGIKQAKRLGAIIKQEEVLDIELNIDGKFIVRSKENVYESLTLILATGTKKIRPNIKNIEKYEGKGVSYCATCDAFFYRNKKVAVLGFDDYAILEANVLKNVCKDVIILTDGSNSNLNSINKKIKSLEGKEKLEYIVFDDDTKLEVDGLFIAMGSAGGADFAKKTGILMNGENIVVNDNMETNIKGLYACGNITGGLLQVNKAGYEGAKAGISAINYINEVKK